MKILIMWLTKLCLYALPRASLPSPPPPPSRRTYHKWHQLPGRACGGDPGDKEVSHSAEQRGLCASESGCNSDDLCIKGICFPGVMLERCWKQEFGNVEGIIRWEICFLRSVATALLFLAWMCCWEGLILLSLEKSLCCYNAFYVWRNTDIMCI